MAFLVLLSLVPVSHAEANQNYLSPEQTNALIETAKTTEGARYVREVAIPSINNGFDCDGLIWYLYKQALGYEIPREVVSIYNNAVEIGLKDLAPGDLIAIKGDGFDNPDNVDKPFTHLFLFLGDINQDGQNEVIHATPEKNPSRNPAIDNQVVIEPADPFLDPEGYINHKFIRIYGSNSAQVGTYFVTDQGANINSTNIVSGLADVLPTKFYYGIAIKGISFDKNFVRFIYDGPDEAYRGKAVYIAKSNLIQYGDLMPYGHLMPQEDSVLAGQSNQLLYIDSTVNVRDANGNKIGEKVRGETFQGFLEGDKYVFLEDGIFKYVHNSFVTQEPISLKVRAKQTFNVRNLNGELLGEMRKDTEFFVDQMGSWFYFDYNGQTARTGKDFLEFIAVEKPIPTEPTTEPTTPPTEPTTKPTTPPTEPTTPPTEPTTEPTTPPTEPTTEPTTPPTEPTTEPTTPPTEPTEPEKPAKPQGIYTNQRANVRSAKTGEVIGAYNKGQYIYATPGKDGYYYFKYNGQDAKIYQSVITTNTGSYLLINNTVNVRDPFNKIVDVKYPGERIYGVRIGDYYRFYDNGVKFIWHSFAAATPQKGTAYVVDGVNVRSESGALLGSLARGMEVTGVQKADGYIYFNYNGQPAKVWADLLEYAMPQGLYFKGTTNIRNQALNKVVDVKYKGERILAVDLGPKSQYYRFVEGNQVRLVYKGLLTSQAQTGTAYVVEPTNIRSESGNLIGSAKRGSAITGVQSADGYVHFTYQNKAAKIWTGGLEYAVPSYKTVKATSNVRDSNLKVIGTKAKDAKIYAVDLGPKSSYYRFYENGTVKLIHKSCVN